MRLPAAASGPRASEAANFYYGISLLPRAKRRAMSAVYAFAAGSTTSATGRSSRPPSWRRWRPERDARPHWRSEQFDTRRSGAGGARATRSCASSCPSTRWSTDRRGRAGRPSDARYETFDELVVYCRHVAGSIGRLCLAIFGAADRDAADTARRRPRRGDAADEHPPRRARGSGARPRLPAGGGSAAVRRATDPSAASPAGARRADPLRGGAQPRVVRRAGCAWSSCSTPAAPRACWR